MVRKTYSGKGSWRKTRRVEETGGAQPKRKREVRRGRRMNRSRTRNGDHIRIRRRRPRYGGGASTIVVSAEGGEGAGHVERGGERQGERLVGNGGGRVVQGLKGRSHGRG